MNGKQTLTVRKPPLTASSKLLINSSRDVVGHAFDREKMIKVVCDLLAIGVLRGADFVPQSELPEIQIADADDSCQASECLAAILRDFPYFRQVASDESLLTWFLQHSKVFWEVDVWYRAMQKYDFVFGNRFHGCIIALQAGTPACVICHDTRTTEMCQFLGLPSVGLEEIEAVNVDALYDQVQPHQIQVRYEELYPLYKSFLNTNSLPNRLV